MENAKTLSDSVEKVTLSGNELIIGLDGRNIKIPISALSEFLGISGPSSMGGVVPNTSFVPEMGSVGNPAIYFAGPGVYPGFGGITLTELLNVISWDSVSAVVKGVPIEVESLSDKVRSWVLAESFLISNPVFDGSGFIISANIIWPDSEEGVISNVVVTSAGITSIRYTRSGGKYATMNITYDSDSNVTGQAIELTGF